MARPSKNATDKAWAKLALAAEEGQVKALESALCAHPSLARRVDKNGMSALMLAASGGHTECVKLLLPVSDALAANCAGLSALMFAARGGNAACVALLLPVSEALATTNRGSSALMLATENGHVECVELLLPVSDLCAKNDWKEMLEVMRTKRAYAH